MSFYTKGTERWGSIWREMGRKRRLRCETGDPLSAVDGKGTDG